MDLNYDIDTWEFSLKGICLVNVCQEILKDALRHYRTPNVNMALDSAKEKVDKLKLPLTIREQINAMLWPIMIEIGNWDSYDPSLHVHVRPVLTPYGTVDHVKSSRAILEADTYCFSQYRLLLFACENCHEEHILKYGRRLESSKNYQVIPRVRWTYSIPAFEEELSNFWYDIYNGNFEKLISRQDLTLEQCEVGFELAIDGRLLVAMKYFAERLSQEVCQRIIDQWLSNYRFDQLTPAIFTFVFSRMSASSRNSWIPRMANKLLLNLLKFPYQHLFLEAAKQLSEHVNDWQHWDLMHDILCKWDAGNKDADYVNIFVQFYQFWANHMRASFINDSIYQDIVQYRFPPPLEPDMIIEQVDTPTDDYNDKDRNKLLMAYHTLRVCMQLVNRTYVRYQALELLIRVYGMGRKDRLVAFRQYIEAYSFGLPVIHSRYHFHYGSQWTGGADKIAGVINKVLSEIGHDNV